MTIPPWLNPPDFIGAASAGASLGNAIADRAQRAQQFQQQLADTQAQREIEKQQFAQSLLAKAQADAEAKRQFQAEQDYKNRALTAGMDENIYKSLLDQANREQELGLRGESLGLQQQRLSAPQANRSEYLQLIDRRDALLAQGKEEEAAMLTPRINHLQMYASEVLPSGKVENITYTSDPLSGKQIPTQRVTTPIQTAQPTTSATAVVTKQKPSALDEFDAKTSELLQGTSGLNEKMRVLSDRSDARKELLKQEGDGGMTLEPSTPPKGEGKKPTKAIAAKYVKAYGQGRAILKLKDDGYDVSGYAD